MKKFSINLLIKKKNENKLNKIVYFSLHYLRYILVITQICVIIVFFYRIILEQEIIDLEESVDEKKEIVRISEPILKEAENLNFKIENIKVILKNQNLFILYFNSLFSLIPKGIMLTNFSFSGSSMQISGITKEIILVKLLMNRLNKENKFKTIDLEKIIKSELGYEFNIKIQI